MPVERCPDTVRRPCLVTVPGVMAWRQAEPSSWHAGWSSLTPSPFPHPLGRVGCMARTVSMLESPVDCAGVACDRNGRRVWMNGGWLDRRARCTKWRSWCARPGPRSMERTRRVLGREASTCPSPKGQQPAGPGPEGWHLSMPLVGFAGVHLTGCWAGAI